MSLRVSLKMKMVLVALKKLRKKSKVATTRTIPLRHQKDLWGRSMNIAQRTKTWKTRKSRATWRVR